MGITTERLIQIDLEYELKISESLSSVISKDFIKHLKNKSSVNMFKDLDYNKSNELTESYKDLLRKELEVFTKSFFYTSEYLKK
jgi:hypothetical protein